MLFFEPLKAGKFLWGQGGSTRKPLAWPHHRAHWGPEALEVKKLIQNGRGQPLTEDLFG